MGIQRQVSPLLQSAGCSQGECFFTARCEGVAEPAEPYFPVTLASMKLTPAKIDLMIVAHSNLTVDLKLQSNTTAPHVFLSTTSPGRFSHNAFVLLPDEPQRVRFYSRALLPDVEKWKSTLGSIPLTTSFPRSCRKQKEAFGSDCSRQIRA